ncbi:HAD-IA family hydrolase [Ornithinibacillus sp. L9]|uniref:Phosphoserine phosphatase n=1 Tax=Ornithinibacillus caprae TaxID=2678566 RepID=A0A6N8FM89_9BACI|nr:HAD family hydrolase [Ornithinibacillus caprae]MUK88859.1 HAD-IA family hydrolase [Ornithinibacillus caprae]
MIKTIIFDLDDTLIWDEKSVNAAFHNTCSIAEEKYGVAPSLLEEKVRLHARELYASYDTYSFTKKIGINPFEGLWGEFDDEGESFRELRKLAPSYQNEAWTRGLKEIGVDDASLVEEMSNKFPEERKNNPFVFEDTFEVLEKVKENYQLLLLTNGSPSLQQTKLRITPQLKDYFEYVVISGDFGSGKPDPNIFDHALELGSANKDEAIMVGDNLHTDILGATRAGIKSVWINRKLKESTNIKPSYEIERLEELLTILPQI